MPHQTMLEFYERRLEIISEQTAKYDDYIKMVKELKKRISGESKIGKTPTNITNLNSKVSDLLEKVKNVIESEKKIYPDYSVKDPILEKLRVISVGRVGDAFSQDKLNEIVSQAETRFDSKVPPGYGPDEEKSGAYSYAGTIIPRKYGDYILWCQILDFAKEAQLPITFITDEQKEDWVIFNKGQKYTRPELRIEISKYSGCDFLVAGTKEFLVKMSKSFNISFDTESIEQISEVVQSQHNWKDEVVACFKSIGGDIPLAVIYRYIEEKRGNNLPASWQSIVRRTIYNHSSDVEAYLGKDDLFERVDEGVWRLRGSEK